MLLIWFNAGSVPSFFVSPSKSCFSFYASALYMNLQNRIELTSSFSSASVKGTLYSAIKVNFVLLINNWHLTTWFWLSWFHYTFSRMLHPDAILWLFFLLDSFQGNPDLIPSLLTLALNDAMTYDKVRLINFTCWNLWWGEDWMLIYFPLSLQASKSGGPNGSIRFRYLSH